MVENTNICEKTVGSLLEGDLTFFVPTYQRGYRWTRDEVTALLNDINNSEGKYCLQPLIIKNNKDGKKWELIDGQQRLTTLYLILWYFKTEKSLDIDKDQRDRIEKLFGIEYATRKNMLDENNEDGPLFLFKEKGSDEEPCNGNIDAYFIYQALKTIDEWFKFLR